MLSDSSNTVDELQLSRRADRLPVALPALRELTARARWVIRPTVIYLVSRALTLAAMAAIMPISHRSVIGEIDTWDSRWFLRAASAGWPDHLAVSHGHVASSTIAFFPLFPLTIRWLADLTPLSLLWSGIVISWITGLTAMVAVWALVRSWADEGLADRATLLVALFPGSFVLSFVYSEGFVVTFVALGLLALLRRRWFLSGLLGLLATATASIALAFELSCLWCAWRAVRTERDWRSLTAPLLTPLGFAAYQIWLWRHTGNLNAWRLTERWGWKSYPSLRFVVHVVVVFVRDPIAANKTDDLLFVGLVVAVILAVVTIRARIPAPLCWYGITAAAIAAMSAPVGIRPRFLLLAFPLIIGLAVRLRGRAYVATAGVFAVLLVGLTAFTVGSWAIFP